MKNCVIIEKIDITQNRIDYDYKVEGDWVEAFNLNEKFFVEYSLDLSSLPESIAVVPLLANLLPMAWVYDAQIITPICDKTFFESIPEIKKGYEDMYPMMELKGSIIAERLEENHYTKDGGTGAFFSGGVDAFNTLVCHNNENPTLITLWGSDVKLDDTKGWKKVLTHIAKTSEEFGSDFVTIKSNFRLFLNEGVLNKVVKNSGDNWWHGFHHGIGIISHGAPIAYLLNKNILYIASSFHISQKGQYTCASDPTIDNFIRFADTKTVHDGYEQTRQEKIKKITDFSKKSGKKIPLRVCWESSGGGNCCKCEKCFRTIMGIYAQGFNPNDFGFDYTKEEFKRLAKKMHYSTHPQLGELRYGPIQKAMKQNIRKEDLPKEIRWFYSIKPSKIGKHPILIFGKKLKDKLKQILRRLGV